jgi:hypothetical protein
MIDWIPHREKLEMLQLQLHQHKTWRGSLAGIIYICMHAVQCIAANICRMHVIQYIYMTYLRLSYIYIELQWSLHSGWTCLPPRHLQMSLFCSPWFQEILSFGTNCQKKKNRKFGLRNKLVYYLLTPHFFWFLVWNELMINHHLILYNYLVSTNTRNEIIPLNLRNELTMYQSHLWCSDYSNQTSPKLHYIISVIHWSLYL